MRALITGIEGFAGQHLKDALESREFDVVGFDIKTGDDIRSYENVRRILDYYRPDRIFHLAALTFVPESFVDPYRTFSINTIGTLNILEAVRNLGLKTKVHVAGTSEELTGSSPYAISKIASSKLAELYGAVVTMAYPHCGPGQGEEFAVSSFAKQIALIERDKLDVLEHGNLEGIKNYTDVRDIVRGYIEAIELESGVYTLCSDQNIPMSDILDTLCALANTSVVTVVNEKLYRPAINSKPPTHDKITKLTGWEPMIDIKTTLSDVLHDWRRRLL